MSDYVISPFWQYVKSGELATCDSCNVTQKVAELIHVATEHDGPTPVRSLHFCKDKQRCDRWKKELGR